VAKMSDQKVIFGDRDVEPAGAEVGAGGEAVAAALLEENDCFLGAHDVFHNGQHGFGDIVNVNGAGEFFAGIN